MPQQTQPTWGTRALVLARSRSYRDVSVALVTEGYARCSPSQVQRFLQAWAAAPVRAARVPVAAPARAARVPVASPTSSGAAVAATEAGKPSGRAKNPATAAVEPAVPAPPRGRAPKREGEEDLPEELRGIDTASLDVEALARLDRALDSFLRAIKVTKSADGESELPGDIKMWTALVRLKMDLRTAMAKLRPPPAVDPNEDPLSLSARDAVLAKIRRAISVHGGAA